MTYPLNRAQALALTVPGNDLDAYMRAVNARAGTERRR